MSESSCLCAAVVGPDRHRPACPVGVELTRLRAENEMLRAKRDFYNEVFERLIERWQSTGDDEQALHDYLAMTWEEYARWVEDP